MNHNPAAEIDPLPAVENLQISGNPIPGQEIQACGYSINGTTSCNFTWMRGFEENSMNLIEGANTPVYKVNEDDLNSYLAIEVVPMDDRGRKGEVMKAFANDKKKIKRGTSK